MIKVMNVISDTNIGGAGKCLLTYLEYANRQNFDVSVVLPAGSLLKPHIDAMRIKTFEIAAMTDRSFDIKAIRELKKIFKAHRPDIVHSHASLSARIAARQCGTTAIAYTRHSVFPPSPLISKGIGKALSGMINNYYCDGIIAVAEAARKNLIDTGVDPNRITVILNGVKPVDELSAQEKSDAKNQFGIHEGQKVVSIIARLNPVKGHEYFIRAAKKVLEHGIRAKFVIAGTGETLGRLRQLSLELGIDSNIVFAGFLDDVCPLLNITDIQVNASFGTEATSLSLLEGMSLGVPAVVSDFGGNPGVIENGKNGLITPQRDADKLADALVRLLGDDVLMDRMQAGAKELYNKKFTARIMSENLECFYKTLLEKGGKKK